MRAKRFRGALNRSGAQKSRLRRGAVALVVTLVAALGVAFTPLPASADVTTTAVAGIGTAGFSGDGGPATNAQFARPVALAVSSGGEITVVDADNYRLRRFMPGGNIATFAGGAQNCAGVISPDQPLGGFCNLYTGYALGGGLTLGSDGSTYVSEGGAIRRVDASGAIYHYAGKYSGGWSNIGDGPKFTFSVDPYELHFNNSTGELDFAEANALRRVTADGNLVTFAGALNYGYIICNQPVDGSPALGSCIGPSGFTVSDSDIYLADNGYYNGGYRNTPSVWRIDAGGTMHLIASGLPTLGRIAVAPSGDIFVSQMNNGQILKIPAGTGAASVYTDTGVTVNDIALDAAGNLLFTSSSVHRVYKVAFVSNIAPVVASIVPDAPSPTDPLLQRGVTITPVNNGATIDHYEYGWAPSGTATAPTKPTQTSTTTHALLNYSVTTPNTNWLLFARAVSTSGIIGPWTAARTELTPKAPMLIVLGDSISSGHHKDVGETKTKCKDNNYGYAKYFSQAWLAALPTTWKFSGQYLNYAQSGFATQGPNGSVVSGGKDACQNNGIASPLNAAKTKLAARPGSWNRVVISAGINDTNWTEAMSWVVATNKATPLTNEGCQAEMWSVWNGDDPSVIGSITQGANAIVGGLRGSDSVAKITWLDYYNIANTGNNPSFPVMDIPMTCVTAVDTALQTIHNAVYAGVPTSVSFLNTDLVLRMDNSKLQPIYLTSYAFEQIMALFNSKNPPGWPHPNATGAQAISGLINVY